MQKKVSYHLRSAVLERVRRREVRIMVKYGRGRAPRDDGAEYNVEVPAKQRGRGDYNLSPCPNHSSFWRGQFARDPDLRTQAGRTDPLQFWRKCANILELCRALSRSERGNLFAQSSFGWREVNLHDIRIRCVGFLDKMDPKPPHFILIVPER